MAIEDFHEPLVGMNEPEGTPVGRVRAPQGTTGYSFITRDTDRVRIGEFVYYSVSDDSGKERWVLGRVTGREAVREYPVSYLSLVEIAPEDILRSIGSEDFTPLFDVEVTIIGYHDKTFGFVNPRLPPHQGTMVCLASDDHLKAVLGSGERGQGNALIGYLLNRPGNRVPLSIDVGEVVSKHLAVLAATGSGKSYTVGVLLEELMGTHNRAAVLVLDPHSEYATLAEMGNLTDNPLVGNRVGFISTSKSTSDGYLPTVKVITEEDIKVRYVDLESADWAGILKDASDKMLNILHESLRRLGKRGGMTGLEGETGRSDSGTRSGTGRNVFGFADIMAELEAVRDDNNSMSIDGLRWRLRAHARKKIFSTGEYTPLREMLRPGQLTIIDMSELEEGHQQLIASLLLRKILQARIKTKKDKVTDGEFHLPYPVFIVLEEAHRFAPASGESRAKRVLKTILSEGRKFGVGTCLVSQRPGKLDSDILSQCMTQIIMKIINPSDQENIKQSVEAVTADLLDELPSLTTGQAVVVGSAINTPVTVRIRERYTRPGGSSSNAPREWREYQESGMRREEQEQAPVTRNRDRELF
jgi:uncharacterized protein